MAYLTETELSAYGFKSVGVDVKISDKAVIYNPEKITIGNYSRIDDFCVVSGNVSIGNYVHITPMCLVAGGIPGITLSDYSTLAYGVKIFSQSDDYSGHTMTNSLIPKKYKKEIFIPVVIGMYAIIGAGSIILPGADIAEGVSVGAMSLVTKKTEPWKIYAGVPAKVMKDRSKNLLNLVSEFKGEKYDSV